MMYKFLPIVAVAAEEFMGRSLTAATTTAAPVIELQGSGYDVTNNIVWRKAHAYIEDFELIYDLNGGTAQSGFADNTSYFVKAKSDTAGDAANTDDGFILKASAGGADIDIETGDGKTDQTEPVTWTPTVATKAAMACGAAGVTGVTAVTADPDATPPVIGVTGVTAVTAVACATAVDAVTADPNATPAVAAVAAYTEFTVTGHGFSDDDEVRYNCADTTTGTQGCMNGMTSGSHWFVKKKAADDTDTIKLTAAKSGTVFLALDATDGTKANWTIAAAAGNSAHSFRRCGAAWKSITTTAKPAAGSSNFHAMVATVFSAFFYLMM